MTHLRHILPIILCLATAQAMPIQLAWDANAEADVVRYEVWKSQPEPRPAIKLLSVQSTAKPSATVDVASGDGVFVTAVNSAGISSAPSNVVTIPNAPASPKNLRITVQVIVNIPNP